MIIHADSLGKLAYLLLSKERCSRILQNKNRLNKNRLNKTRDTYNKLSWNISFS